MDPSSSNSLALPAKRKTPPEQQQQQLQQQQQQQQQQQEAVTLETHHLYRRLFHRPQPLLQQQRTDLQVVQSLLELCPLRVSASELVSEKLGARVLRLDDSRQQQHKRKQQEQQKQQQQRPKQKHLLKLSRTQAKRLGLFDVAAEFGSSSSKSSRHRQQQLQQQRQQEKQQQQQNGLTLEDMLPLCQLWQQYALSVCGVETTAAAAAAAADSSSSSRGVRNKGGGTAVYAQGLSKLTAFNRCGAAAQMDLHGAWVSVHRSTCPSLCGIAGLVVLDTQQCFLLLGADGRTRRVPKSCCVFLLLLADGSKFFLQGQHLLHAPAARSKVKLKPKLSLLL
ncbi:hypothetical protein Esti_001655 [Eimeria stiedai]